MVAKFVSAQASLVPRLCAIAPVARRSRPERTGVVATLASVPVPLAKSQCAHHVLLPRCSPDTRTNLVVRLVNARAEFAKPPSATARRGRKS